MKNTALLLIAASIILPAVAKPLGNRGLRGNGKDDAIERIALREETRLDVKDTHTLAKLNEDAEAKDFRPTHLGEYTQHTIRRIVRLNAIGALETSQADTFKDLHGEIVEIGNSYKADGTVTDEEKDEYRNLLDKLNDDINALYQTPEEGSNRTPLTNRTQLRLEQQIDSAERTGRISASKANSLRRKLDSLERTEARIKSGEELSTREREKLIEETLETRREIMQEILD